MNRPRAWHEEGSPPEFARLFRAARSEQPTQASLQRALSIVGIAAASSTLAASGNAKVSTLVGEGGAKASTLAGKWAFGTLTQWVVAIAVGASTVTAAAIMVRHEAVVPTTARGNAAVPPAPSNRCPMGLCRSLSAIAVEERSASEEPVPISSVDVKPTADTRKSLTGSTSPRVPHSRRSHDEAEPEHAKDEGPDEKALWLEEMALIDAARAALHGNHHVTAMQLATAYVRQYPSGQFYPEALYLVVEAASRLGQRQTALGAAHEFLERYQDAPEAKRVRAILDSQGKRGIP